MCADGLERATARSIRSATEATPSRDVFAEQPLDYIRAYGSPPLWCVVDVLRAELDSHNGGGAFARARVHDCALAHHATPRAVLAVLAEQQADRWPEKETLTRTLVAEAQARNSPMWGGMLIVAYAPMLHRVACKLRARPTEVEDLDSLLIVVFLGVVDGLVLSTTEQRTCSALRFGTWNALERVFRAAARTNEHVVDLAFLGNGDNDVPSVENLVSTCGARWDSGERLGRRRRRDLGRGDVQEVASLIRERASDLGEERLQRFVERTVGGLTTRAYIEKHHPGVSGAEGQLLYERHKRDHTRTRRLLQRRFCDWPPPDPPASPFALSDELLSGGRTDDGP